MQVGDRIRVDITSPGRRFDGVGALSGSAVRLLLDYPEPERSQILDYLFAPSYGASLHILKLEIGADTNSTTTAERGHMRTRDDFDPHRGWSWWIAEQAKARNPDIMLYGLMWGAPGWFDGGLWSSDHVDYVLAWLDAAYEQDLHIDYVGGANEWYDPSPRADFFVQLKKELRRRHPHVQVVATDSHTPPHYWWAATHMRTDADFRDAVDILGEHDVCEWRSPYYHCHVSDDALALGKPLWNSEQSSQDAEAGAPALARAMNRHYIDGRVTANLNWAAIAAFYGNTKTGGTGLMVAEWPWSGYYRVTPSIWVDAHTTQFVQPGWRYLDSGCGYLPNGGSYVTLQDPTGTDVTIVVETVDATAAETVEVVSADAWDGRRMQVWATDLTSTDPADWFVPQPGITFEDAAFVTTLELGRLYTFSTTTGQRRGDAQPRSGAEASTRMPLPHTETFADTGPLRPARYFQDVQGGFDTVPQHEPADLPAYRQVIDTPPIRWHASRVIPASIVGDPLWWGDYRVTAGVLFEDSAAVELLGRVEYYDADCLRGYHLQLAPTGDWLLYTEDRQRERSVLAQGHAGLLRHGWHRLTLEFLGTTVTATLDADTVLTTLHDAHHTSGQVGLAVDGWAHAQFRDLRIEPTGQPPRFAAQHALRATATSAHENLYRHQTYPAARVLDGRAETRWISAFDPRVPLPQALTLDLGQATRTHGLTYKPPLQGTDVDAVITEYRIAGSRDGDHYETLAEGSWQPTIATKVVSWPAHSARYVRLEALDSTNGLAAASEVNIALEPFPGPWLDPPGW